MILAKERILALVEENKLLEHSVPEAFTGAGYDLRVARFYRIKGEALLGAKERKLPSAVEEKTDKIVLAPDEYILIETLEKVHMPDNLMARILPRSSLFRCGCALITAVVDPGYYGTLTLGLKNLSSSPFTLEKGARVGQIVFEEVAGKTELYSGKYQGGKVV